MEEREEVVDELYGLTEEEYYQYLQDMYDYNMYLQAEYYRQMRELSTTEEELFMLIEEVEREESENL